MNPAAEPGPVRALVVDDSPDVLAMVVRCFSERGHACTPAATGEAALSMLAAEPFDLMLADLTLSAAGDMAVLTHAFRADPAPLVMVMTRYTDLETAIKAVQAGAYDLMTKPFTPAELAVKVDNLSGLVHLRREHDVLVRELADAYRVIAHLSETDQVEADRPGAGTTQPEAAAKSDADHQDMATSADGTPSSPPAEALPATAASVVPPTVPPLPNAPRISTNAIAAYRSVAWAPDRSARRLWALYQQGTISREEYDRLSALAPHDLPTA